MSLAACIISLFQFAVELFEHGVLRLLELEKEWFVISGEEKSNAAKRADGADTNRLEYEVLQYEALE
jgi:hypothetical protein